MLSITYIRRLSSAMLLVAAMASAQAQQSEPDAELEVNVLEVNLPDRTPEKCLLSNRISRTEVVDDRTVLFYTRGGDVYQNILPGDCPGLKRNSRFTYEPFSNRLCDSDTVTVLVRFGRDLSRGSTCRLGEYHPLSEWEAEDLLLAKDEPAPGGGSTVEAPPAELPDDPDEDDAD